MAQIIPAALSGYITLQFLPPNAPLAQYIGTRGISQFFYVSKIRNFVTFTRKMRKSLVLWLSWQIPCLSRGYGAEMPVMDNFNNSNDCGEKFQTQDDLETHKGTNIVINLSKEGRMQCVA